MSFLDTILADLKLLDIEYEEHYDPRGAQIFKLYRQDSTSPMLIRPPGNPSHIFINLSVKYPIPLLEKIPHGDRHLLDSMLKELGSKLIVHNKIRLDHDSLFFSSGFILTGETYDLQNMRNSLESLMESYETVIDAINDNIHNSR